MKRKIYKLLSSAKQVLFALALVTMPSLSYSQTTYTYGYTGTIQTLNLSAGLYKIEAWGANGGGSQGGKGGYSTGTLTLGSATTIYVVVGGAGGTGGIPADINGGYNGGGPRPTPGGATRGSGGGATHIATASGLLSTLSTNQSAVKIVAGGGGGGSNAGAGVGNGGGLSGQNSNGANPGLGGTQTAGGAAGAGTSGSPGTFGQGGQSLDYAGAGGGGWYGGGAGGGSIGGNNSNGGGGGSSYIGGVANGFTAMFGTTGFVTNPVATGDGYVIITELSQPCTASIETPTITSAASVNSLCLHAGETAILDPFFGSGSYVGVNYNWLASSSPSGPFSPVATSTNPSYVTPSVGATAVYYMLEATCVSAGVTVASGVFGVLPNPTLALSSVPAINFTLSSLTVCTNDHYTITANGASTYTWNNGAGQAANVNPYILTPVAAFPDYTVTGTSAEGCTDTNTMTIATILDAPIVLLNATANNICEGSNVLLSVTGNAYIFSWAPNISSNAPIISVAPTSSTEYTVTAAAVNGCSQTATQMINVNAPPVISVITSTTPGQTPCAGEEINMAASGAITYTWLSNGGYFQGPTIIATPEASTTYYVNGTDQNGCTGTTIFNLVVADCVGITELNANNGVSIYPNPNNGEFVVELNDGSAKSIELYDLTGRVVLSNTASDNKVNVNINHLSNGVYYLKVTSDSTTKMVKVVKQ